MKFQGLASKFQGLALIALKYGYVPLYSKGENWMSLIDVNDCCSLALHISRQSRIFQIINLFNPNLIVRQIEFVEMISEVLNIPFLRFGRQKFLTPSSNSINPKIYFVMSFRG